MSKNQPRSKADRSRWDAIREAIHELSEDGKGGEREAVLKRAGILAGVHEREIEHTVAEMERQGEIYRVNGHLKDTNAVLRGDHP